MSTEKIKNIINQQKKIWLVIGFSTVLVLTALVQSGAFAEAADISQSDTEEVAEQQTATQKLQSVNFRSDMPIRNAMKLLAVKYHRNIIPSSDVDGTVMAGILYDVTFEEAMDAILGYQFKWEDDGKFVWVYTAEEYEKIKFDKMRMEHKVLTLYYITAEEAKKLIAPVLSEHGEIECSTAATIGITTSDTGAKSQAGGNAMALHDTVVIYDFPERIEKAENIINKIDIRPAQVLIEAVILSAKLTDETKFGVDWSALSGATVGALANMGTGGSDVSMTGFADTGTKGLRLGISIDNMNVLITAIEEIVDLTVLAKPNVLALNKQEGIVYIGTRMGYASQTEQNQSGSTTQKVEFLETGTRLAFRPYIAADGYIRMDIYPKSSTGTVANGIPDETTTELSANLMVKDGHTIVIGGLFRDSVNSGKSQVPVLGNIPIVGGLFRKTSDITIREEVIVMLTPHIIEDPGLTNGKKISEDVSRKLHGANQGIQWIHTDKLARNHYIKAVELYAAEDTEEALNELNMATLDRPTYLDAIKLRERIIAETAPEDYQMLERIMLEKMKTENQ